MENLAEAEAQCDSPISICLYCAIPEQNQFEVRRYGFRDCSKSILRNVLNAALTSLTGRLKFDVHSYKVANSLDDNSNRGDMAIRIALRSQLEIAFSPRKLSFSEVKWGDLARHLHTINSDASLFLIAGGGYLSIDGDGSPWGMLAKSQILEELKCPIVASGIGLNRLMNEPLSDISGLPEETRSRIYKLSALCRKISVRDLNTVALFAAYGQKNAVLTGDPVLYFDDEARPPSLQSARMKIGINLASHGPRTHSILEPILPDIIRLLRWIQQDRDAEFVYLMHHDFERPIAEYLRRKGVKLQIIDLPPEGLIGAYKGLDFVINQMLHSCIFAANAGVPFLNMAYDIKCRAFCTLLDVPECGLDSEGVSFELMKARLEELFQNRATLSVRILEHKTILRAEGLAFLKELVNLVTEQRSDLRATATAAP
jgi:polysaccharide pyruvyl transferase WcaK-like protein